MNETDPISVRCEELITFLSRCVSCKNSSNYLNDCTRHDDIEYFATLNLLTSNRLERHCSYKEDKDMLIFFTLVYMENLVTKNYMYFSKFVKDSMRHVFWNFLFSIPLETDVFKCFVVTEERTGYLLFNSSGGLECSDSKYSPFGNFWNQLDTFSVGNLTYPAKNKLAQVMCNLILLDESSNAFDVLSMSYFVIEYMLSIVIQSYVLKILRQQTGSLPPELLMICSLFKICNTEQKRRELLTQVPQGYQADGPEIYVRTCTESVYLCAVIDVVILVFKELLMRFSTCSKGPINMEKLVDLKNRMIKLSDQWFRFFTFIFWYSLAFKKRHTFLLLLEITVEWNKVCPTLYFFHREDSPLKLITNMVKTYFGLRNKWKDSIEELYDKTVYDTSQDPFCLAIFTQWYTEYVDVNKAVLNPSLIRFLSHVLLKESCIPELQITLIEISEYFKTLKRGSIPSDLEPKKIALFILEYTSTNLNLFDYNDCVHQKRFIELLRTVCGVNLHHIFNDIGITNQVFTACLSCLLRNFVHPNPQIVLDVLGCCSKLISLHKDYLFLKFDDEPLERNGNISVCDADHLLFEEKKKLFENQVILTEEHLREMCKVLIIQYIYIPEFTLKDHAINRKWMINFMMTMMNTYNEEWYEHYLKNLEEERSMECDMEEQCFQMIRNRVKRLLEILVSLHHKVFHVIMQIFGGFMEQLLQLMHECSSVHSVSNEMSRLLSEQIALQESFLGTLIFSGFDLFKLLIQMKEKCLCMVTEACPALTKDLLKYELHPLKNAETFEQIMKDKLRLREYVMNILSGKQSLIPGKELEIFGTLKRREIEDLRNHEDKMIAHIALLNERMSVVNAQIRIMNEMTVRDCSPYYYLCDTCMNILWKTFESFYNANFTHIKNLKDLELFQKRKNAMLKDCCHILVYQDRVFCFVEELMDLIWGDSNTNTIATMDTTTTTTNNNNKGITNEVKLQYLSICSTLLNKMKIFLNRYTLGGMLIRILDGYTDGTQISEEIIPFMVFLVYLGFTIEDEVVLKDDFSFNVLKKPDLIVSDRDEILVYLDWILKKICTLFEEMKIKLEEGVTVCTMLYEKNTLSPFVRMMDKVESNHVESGVTGFLKMGEVVHLFYSYMNIYRNFLKKFNGVECIDPMIKNILKRSRFQNYLLLFPNYEINREQQEHFLDFTNTLHIQLSEKYKYVQIAFFLMECLTSVLYSLYVRLLQFNETKQFCPYIKLEMNYTMLSSEEQQLYALFNKKTESFDETFGNRGERNITNVEDENVVTTYNKNKKITTTVIKNEKVLTKDKVGIEKYGCIIQSDDNRELLKYIFSKERGRGMSYFFQNLCLVIKDFIKEHYFIGYAKFGELTNLLAQMLCLTEFPCFGVDAMKVFEILGEEIWNMIRSRLMNVYFASSICQIFSRVVEGSARFLREAARNRNMLNFKMKDNSNISENDYSILLGMVYEDITTFAKSFLEVCRKFVEYNGKFRNQKDGLFFEVFYALIQPETMDYLLLNCKMLLNFFEYGIIRETLRLLIDMSESMMHVQWNKNTVGKLYLKILQLLFDVCIHFNPYNGGLTSQISNSDGTNFLNQGPEYMVKMGATSDESQHHMLPSVSSYQFSQFICKSATDPSSYVYHFVHAFVTISSHYFTVLRSKVTEFKKSEIELIDTRSLMYFDVIKEYLLIFRDVKELEELDLDALCKELLKGTKSKKLKELLTVHILNGKPNAMKGRIAR